MDNTDSHRFVRAPAESLTGVHDNGADGTETTASPERTNPKPRKISRRRLMEELIALKTELAIVRSEKEQLVRDKDVSGTATDQASQSERSTVNEHSKSESESLLVTTMNHIGHLARTCSAAARQGLGQKRLHSGPEEEEPRPKLAAITQNGEDNEERMQDVVKVE
nr:uncharacterized protein LOC115259238 [Aedes albopictus]